MVNLFANGLSPQAFVLKVAFINYIEGCQKAHDGQLPILYLTLRWVCCSNCKQWTQCFLECVAVLFAICASINLVDLTQ